MASIDELIRQQIYQALDQQRKARSSAFDDTERIASILGGRGGQGGGGPSTVAGAMGGGMAAPTQTVGDMAAQNISPEDYNYYVDIERRDAFDDGEKVGWDKKVKRWAEVREKAEPTRGDLHASPGEGGMKADDKKRARDAMGRFIARKQQQEETPDDIFGY